MATNAKDILKQMSAERRTKIQQRAEKLMAEYEALQELRKALGVTQEELADRLAVSQNSISGIESRKDMKLSTLMSYIKALGGDLEVTVRLEGQDPIKLTAFSEQHS